MTKGGEKRRGNRRGRNRGRRYGTLCSSQPFPISVVDMDPLSFGIMDPILIFVPKRLLAVAPQSRYGM